MFNTSQNNKMVEVLSGAERRRRRAPQEKITIIQQTMEPGIRTMLDGSNIGSSPRCGELESILLSRQPNTGSSPQMRGTLPPSQRR